MVKKICVLVLVCVVNFTSAEDTKPFDCVSELMSQPSCINRLNATRACKMFGGSPKAVTMIQKCVADHGYSGYTEVSAPINIVALCLAGISGSSKASDNETFCKKGDASKPTEVSDSTMPKIIENSGETKIEAVKVIEK